MIDALSALTDEEKDILNGKGIRKTDYSQTERFIVDGKKLLGSEPFNLRRHTRFIEFPEHGHDYMEMMYVYAGTVTHWIGKEKITLQRGDILFLNKHVRHSISRADAQDLGINFILSDDFLQTLLNGAGSNPVIKRFLEENLTEYGEGAYLYFQTQNNFCIRNLMNNLIYAIVNRTKELYGGILTLLFSYLSYYENTLVNASSYTTPEARFQKAVLSYLETDYRSATLKELAENMGYNEAYLSRRIRLTTGASFRTLLQNKRMDCAAALLASTALTVEQVIHAVGYENQSFFHRNFQLRYGLTPLQYRKQFIKG